VNSITTKTALILGAALTAGAAVAATPAPTTNPYVAGDMHNHNICQDGSVSAARSLDRAVGSGLATNGATNFNLDWFTLGNHGGNGNRDCRFDDTNPGAGASNAVPSPVQYWSQTLGQAINFDGVYGGPGSVVISQLKGTPSGTGTGASMWHWQAQQDIEYPMIVDRSAKYQKVLIDGLEWVVPGHEHTDVAIVKGQTPLKAKVGNANAISEFEFRFDRQDLDLIGPVNAAGASIWAGAQKDPVPARRRRALPATRRPWLRSHGCRPTIRLILTQFRRTLSVRVRSTPPAIPATTLTTSVTSITLRQPWLSASSPRDTRHRAASRAARARTARARSAAAPTV